MEPTISLTVDTKSGEDLYVYPYSIKYGVKQKLYYYCSPEFTVNNTNDFFIKYHYNSLVANTLIAKQILTEWFKEFTYQFNWFFGSNCFKHNFNNYQWHLNLTYLKAVKELSYVLPATSVFGRNISLRGQLRITTNKYFEDVYLTPTKDYFDERLDEWINEDVEALFVDDIYTIEEDKQELVQFYSQQRLDYKNWRDTELAKGNEIQYLYSLNT